MPTYEVTIRACVTKTLIVTADTQDEAYELAHDQFSVVHDPSIPEKYEEETLAVEEVETAQ